MGLEIALCFFMPIARFLSAKERKSNIAIHFFPIALEKNSDESDPILGIKMGKAVKNLWKHGKKKLIFFKRITSFWEQFARITSESMMLLFFNKIESDLLTFAFLKERRERLAHSRSFLKSNKSESLTVAI